MADETPPHWTAGVFTPDAPGALIPDWHTKAPEPAKWEAYKGAKTFDDLITTAEKRVADAQTALRTRPAALPDRPDDSAAPEAFAAWRAANGLPATADEYGLGERPEGLPDELWNADEVKSFSEFVHEKGIPKKHAESIAQWYRENAKTAFASTKDAQSQSVATREAEAAALRAAETAVLQSKYGARLDTVLRDIQSVAQAAGVSPKFFDPAAVEFQGTQFVDLFTTLLSRIPRGEDKTGQRFGAPVAGQYDKAWAKAAIVPGHADYEALTNPRHPRHAALTQARNEAYAMG